MTILLVEDEVKLNQLIASYLTHSGYHVRSFVDGAKAWQSWVEGDYQLVILDIMVPGLDGWSLCRRIRAVSDVPILILTSRADEDDRIMGFELGADDYVVKPFSPKELVLRVQALLKRSAFKDKSKERINLGALTVDALARVATIGEQRLDLTPKEYDLLLYFLNNPNVAISRDSLLQEVWGYDYLGGSRTVDTHVKNLREKVFKIQELPATLKTVWGYGYLFEVQNA